MKNFDFIKELAEVIPAFHQLHAYCDKAEIFQKAFPEESAANARKALEWLVKNHLAMANVTLAPHETLNNMLKRPQIDAFINEAWEFEQNMRMEILHVHGHIPGGKAAIEVKIEGMNKQFHPSGTGYADYVLFSKGSKPLAVIEAKSTIHSPETGRKQAIEYADCLEKKYGV